MKVGIIIHSHTGNTLSVGEKLKEALIAGEHTVQLDRVTAVNENPNSKERIILDTIPVITNYDAIIFGAPVRGFSLSPVMKTYLTQLSVFNGKKVACFVTEYFPKPWMGGNHAVSQMTRIIAQKGGILTDTGVINWTNKAREEQIQDVLVRLCRL